MKKFVFLSTAAGGRFREGEKTACRRETLVKQISIENTQIDSMYIYMCCQQTQIHLRERDWGIVEFGSQLDLHD